MAGDCISQNSWRWLDEFDLSRAEKGFPSNAAANRFHVYNFVGRRSEFDMAPSVSLIENRTIQLRLIKTMYMSSRKRLEAMFLGRSRGPFRSSNSLALRVNSAQGLKRTGLQLRNPGRQVSIQVCMARMFYVHQLLHVVSWSGFVQYTEEFAPDAFTETAHTLGQRPGLDPFGHSKESKAKKANVYMTSTKWSPSKIQTRIKQSPKK